MAMEIEVLRTLLSEWEFRQRRNWVTALLSLKYRDISNIWQSSYLLWQVSRVVLKCLLPAQQFCLETCILLSSPWCYKNENLAETWCLSYILILSVKCNLPWVSVSVQVCPGDLVEKHINTLCVGVWKKASKDQTDVFIFVGTHTF